MFASNHFMCKVNPFQITCLVILSKQSIRPKVSSLENFSRGLKTFFSSSYNKDLRLKECTDISWWHVKKIFLNCKYVFMNKFAKFFIASNTWSVSKKKFFYSDFLFLLENDFFKSEIFFRFEKNKFTKSFTNFI